jgi:hypothetical protein
VGQESIFNKHYRRSEESIIGESGMEEEDLISKIISTIERIKGIKGVVNGMELIGKKIYCKCGNLIYTEGEKELQNVIENEELICDFVDYLCAKCRRRLFLDESTQKKSDPPPPPPPPMLSIENAKNTLSVPANKAPNTFKTNNSEKKSFAKLWSFLRGAFYAMVVAFIILFLQSNGVIHIQYLEPLLKIIHMSPPPNGSGSVLPDIDRDILTLPAGVQINMGKCMKEYAINQSDTSQVVTSFINSALEEKKANKIIVSYVIDKLYEKEHIDIRDEKNYIDFITCLVSDIK